MNCPHCGLAIPAKGKAAESKYREDIAKAWKAIDALERTLGQSYMQWELNGVQSHSAFRVACESERDRLLGVIDDPQKLYAIYRRGDKRTPVNYGMVPDLAVETSPVAVAA